MKKERYSAAEIEIIRIKTMDVLSGSPGDDDDDDDSLPFVSGH